MPATFNITELIYGGGTHFAGAVLRGVQYEVASGTLIPNQGEKRFVAVNESGIMRQMTMQVCEVSKALLSVYKVVDFVQSLSL